MKIDLSAPSRLSRVVLLPAVLAMVQAWCPCGSASAAEANGSIAVESVGSAPVGNRGAIRVLLGTGTEVKGGRAIQLGSNGRLVLVRTVRTPRIDIDILTKGLFREAKNTGAKSSQVAARNTEHIARIAKPRRPGRSRAKNRVRRAAAAVARANAIRIVAAGPAKGVANPPPGGAQTPIGPFNPNPPINPGRRR